MSSLFSTPSTPSEDPSARALRDAEQRRAERDRIQATQDQLSLETRLRNRSGGIASLFGSRRGLTSLLGSG